MSKNIPSSFNSLTMCMLHNIKGFEIDNSRCQQLMEYWRQIVFHKFILQVQKTVINFIQLQRTTT